ncbi:MAG TPA: zinc-dependent alcohol dehydrogenase family protein [Kofleriaceae bacterium]|nr:zinc-dependent alcohol dehydrogenase family protein [Kofleriaceae bacterium]
MRAMVLERIATPLALRERPDPEPGPGEVRVRVAACAVCRTDLHVVDGELDAVPVPIVPGHQVVGVVDRVGPEVSGLAPGQRVGVPWLGWTCGACRFCATGRENLCDQARFTGYTRDGGFADLVVADARYALPVPDALGADATAIAPLLCAGLIGQRALRAAGDPRRLGLWGFGAAAHLVIQMAIAEGRECYAFTRPGDRRAQAFARQLGAVWAGGSDQTPPHLLDGSILFAPVGALVPAALACLDKGGTVVAAGIHMSQVPAFDYRLLWGERAVRSVANLTRQDGLDTLALAARVPLVAHASAYPLADANRALADLRGGHLDGAAVLVTG